MTTSKNKSTDLGLSEPQRRLSPWRVLVALAILSGLVAGGTYMFQTWQRAQPTTSAEPWYAGYVDVTATPVYGFEQVSTDIKRDAVLSFVVSLTSDPCIPSWGGVYTLDAAGEKLDLDRRIVRFRQQGGNIAVSFGGLLNDELALKCTDHEKLLKAYSSVIDRYRLEVIDLDLERSSLADKDAAKRRAKAIADLQNKRRADGKRLSVWVTLPVAPQGLTEVGTDAIASLLAGGVDITGVNVMTMDYGESRTQGQSMYDASRAALVQTHRQLGILYQQAGITLNNASLWSKIGATPMIGQNDVIDEVFTLDDARNLNQYARSKKLGRMSMWSANRDIQCGSNYVNLKVVSDSCSGIAQDKYSFAVILGEGFQGNLTRSAGAVTIEDTATNEQIKDDPKTSPYQIWTDSGTYLEGTKVVWHGNVYQAKWWTQGDSPDNPVLQSWQTPWELIGPVLPGEKPIIQATLPPGTYPDWSGTTGYDAGSRVLFNGVPFQAKWWTQGDSPAAASSSADSSPWTPLTQSQINEIAEKTSP